MRYYHVFTMLLSLVFITPAVSAPSNVTEETSVLMQFKQPMKSSQFIEWARKFNGEILELRHSHMYITGVYTPPIGMEPQKAFETMLQKHSKFLAEANSLVADELASSSDKKIQESLSKLKSGFESSIQEVESDNFGIVLVKVKANKLSILNKDSYVLQTVIVQTTPKNKSDRQMTGARFALGSLKPVSYSHESWAPYYGTTKTTQYMAFNTFYFDDISYYGAWDSYEHETQVYNGNFADYDNYWSSNLPTAYKDSQVSDNPNSDNFAIGTLTPTALSTY